MTYNATLTLDETKEVTKKITVNSPSMFSVLMALSKAVKEDSSLVGRKIALADIVKA